jgi:hypothetical protein
MIPSSCKRIHRVAVRHIVATMLVLRSARVQDASSRAAGTRIADDACHQQRDLEGPRTPKATQRIARDASLARGSARAPRCPATPARLSPAMPSRHDEAGDPQRATRWFRIGAVLRIAGSRTCLAIACRVASGAPQQARRRAPFGRRGILDFAGLHRGASPGKGPPRSPPEATGEESRPSLPREMNAPCRRQTFSPPPARRPSSGCPARLSPSAFAPRRITRPICRRCPA